MGIIINIFFNILNSLFDALTPPGFLRKWHLTIRLKKTKKIVACITAIPARICVNEEKINMVEINFLCVHKKLRNKRLAPVLIREITRRVNCEDVWQASYTAGVIIPRPIARNQYWHRSLSPRKLVEIGFSGIPRNSSIDDMIVLEKIPSQNTISLRPMNKNDCSQVCKLLEDYFRKFKYAPTLNESQIAHWFLPRKDIISSFVIENFEGSVTDFFSFYSLSSHVIGNYKYSILNAVYSYYNIAVSISWKNLMLQALIIAKQVKK